MEEQKQSLKKVLAEDNSESNEILGEQNANAIGMKWFKFIIYFALWAGALLNIVNGIRQITGNIYLSEGVSPETIYEAFPNLKGADVLLGLISCALGIFQIATRFSLAHYKTYAPTMLHVSYVFVIIFDVISSIVVSSITGIETFSTIVASLIGTIICLVINVKYFNNRKHLFIN